MFSTVISNGLRTFVFVRSLSASNRYTLFDSEERSAHFAEPLVYGTRPIALTVRRDGSGRRTVSETLIEVSNKRVARWRERRFGVRGVAVLSPGLAKSAS